MQSEIQLTALNKAQIQRQFDRSARRYDQVAQMQRKIVGDMLDLAGSTKGSVSTSSILDAGCGTGYGLQELVNAYPQADFSGLDLAPSMLEVARKCTPQAQFYQGDIEQLPFSDQSFDLVWSSSAIQWCETQQAISELARVAQSGGQVLISTFSEGTLTQWRSLWSLGESERRFESVETIESSVIKAGLKNIRIHSKTYTQAFFSFTEAVNSIRDLGAGNAEYDRSKGLLGAARYKSIRRKFEQVIEQQGQFDMPYVVTFIIAQKPQS